MSERSRAYRRPEERAERRMPASRYRTHEHSRWSGIFALLLYFGGGIAIVVAVSMLFVPDAPTRVASTFNAVSQGIGGVVEHIALLLGFTRNA